MITTFQCRLAALAISQICVWINTLHRNHQTDDWNYVFADYCWLYELIHIIICFKSILQIFFAMYPFITSFVVNSAKTAAFRQHFSYQMCFSNMNVPQTFFGNNHIIHFQAIIWAQNYDMQALCACRIVMTWDTRIVAASCGAQKSRCMSIASLYTSHFCWQTAILSIFQTSINNQLTQAIMIISVYPLNISCWFLFVVLFSAAGNAPQQNNVFHGWFMTR